MTQVETSVFLEIVKQVPALAVLVFVVIHFLRYLEKTTKSSNDRTELLLEPYKQSVETIRSSIEHLAAEIADAKRVSARLAQIIMYHDATVKGENPETFGDPKEFVEKILKGG